MALPLKGDMAMGLEEAMVPHVCQQSFILVSVPPHSTAAQSYGGGYAATPAAPAAASGYGYGAPGGYQQVLPVQLWSLVNKEKDMARWSALRKSPRSRVKKVCADIWKKRKVLLVFTAVVPTLEVAIVCFL